MIRVIQVLACLLAVGILAACGAPTVSTTAGSATSSAAPATSSAAPAADGSAEHPLAFGQHYDGQNLSVTISAPAPYTPGTGAFSPNQAPRAVVMTITVTNRASTAMPSMGISVQATAGGAQAQEIVDIANNVGSTTADILPGKALSWKIAFGLPAAPGDFTVQTSSLGGGKTIYFAGRA